MTQIPILFGRYLSPYVRRVAITLNIYGMEYRQQVMSAVGDEAAREAVNPVGRVPAFQLPSGETLIDSAAILDHLDETAGPANSLMAAKGVARRTALYQLAIATGAIDRAMTANAERRRPDGQRDDARIERLLRQCRQGFGVLDSDFGAGPYFGGDELGQPDVTAAVGFTFVNHIFPGTLPADDFPDLARLAVQCEGMSAFQQIRID